MINGFRLPRGVMDIFKINEITGWEVDENLNHRPDRVLNLFGESSIETEILNNNLNNTSPISLKTRQFYFTINDRFHKYFGRL